MTEKIKLTSFMKQGDTFAAEFVANADVLDKFATLTGDRNSLHTDILFARRSVYRVNVVHGMVPILFLALLKIPCDEKYEYAFYEMSARFLRPILIEERLSLLSEVIGINEEKKEIKFEYRLNECTAGALVATGSYTLSYGEKELPSNSKDMQSVESGKISDGTCMLIDELTEADLLFDDISRQDERSFCFEISDGSAYLLYDILKSGFVPGKKNESIDRRSIYNLTNLLAGSLFSTFVGMCLPGKHATFMEFMVTFKKSISLNKKYLLKGSVNFKSKSTLTLKEDIVIRSVEGKAYSHAEGKANVKVNEPSVSMPSIGYLKANEKDLGLKDKVILITGASRGIGEAAAKLFSLYGTKVAVNYCLGKDDAERVVNEIRESGGDAISVQSDVRDRVQVKDMVRHVSDIYGTIDILVNNAVGSFYPKKFLEQSWEEVQKEIDVTIKGAFNCCQETIPVMMKNKGGKIINMATIAVEVPPSDQFKYVVSKSAVMGLTRSLAVEFAPHNILVNMVVPSVVETDLTKHIPKILMNTMRNKTPLKRNATAIDVAKSIVALASSLSSFTTGQKVMVTGGNPPFL